MDQPSDLMQRLGIVQDEFEAISETNRKRQEAAMKAEMEKRSKLGRG